MEQQWRWRMVALVIIAVVLQGSGGRVDAGVVQPQLVAPNPEFLRYDGSTQFEGGAAGLGLVPSPVDWGYLDGEHVTWLGANAPLPASYDLRAEGRMTGVRAQGTSGSCWAFATYGSLESNMMPAETLDFSENNLKNASGFDSGPNDGGNGDMSTAYLARWSGPIAEADDPYNPNSTTSPSGLSPVRHVQDVMMLPERSGPLDTADIKHALIDYGALVGSMYLVEDTAYYKLSTGAYYYAGSFEGNHDITVAGWDDAFPASNFSTPPPGNGAWIVKNSWGTAWGQSGYLFISYYDAVLFKKNPAYCFEVAEPTDNYMHVYQYDPLGHTRSLGYGTDTAWEANVFVAAAAEDVRAIGFYTLDVSCSYEAKIYGSWNGSTFSNLLSSTTGTIPSPGYHTIVLPSSGAPVASGQTFGVVVKMETTNYRYPIALERPVAGYSMRATASSGQSYVSPDGTSWTDVTDRYANANVCVKAYAGTPSATVTLTYQASPAGAGFVSASPPSADNTYSTGTVVTLTATPATGYTFTGWSGDLSGTTNPTTITMSANRSVTAVFQAGALPDLTVDTLYFNPAQPTPGGSVTLAFTIHNQGLASVTADYDMSIYVDGVYRAGGTNTDRLANGASDDGWHWDTTWPSDTTSHTFMVVLDPNNVITESNESNNSASLSASGAPVMYTLTTTASPSASGSVDKSPDAASYASGTVVTLTATPATGYSFTSWSGALTGTANPATITMDANKSVTATFTSSTTTSGDIDGNGTVNTLDVLLAARAAVSIGTPLTGSALQAADVNHDGTINTLDVLLIARIAVGLS